MMIPTSHQGISESVADDDVVLSVEGVSKKFCRSLKRSLFYGVQDITSELFGTRQTNYQLRPQEFWALKDINLQLRRGESLGLIGVNGSGKTTLLRIISGLIRPDAGSVRIRGRVAPLIALGAGFNPILTGRENVYANMSILGLTSKQIDQRFDEVVEFAGIGEAINSPVQSYSSGMAVRLGFACAVHTQPDILLIDEVLVVGDIKFKTKCYAKLYQLRQSGVSFIMVSHTSSIISTICEQAVYIREGQKVLEGNAVEVLHKYEEDLFIGNAQETLGAMQFSRENLQESTGLDIISVFFTDQIGNKVDAPTSGEYTCLNIECETTQPFDQVSLVIDVKHLASESDCILYMNSADDSSPLTLPGGKCKIQMQFPYLGLGVGLYEARISIRKEKIRLLDKINSFRFTVKRAKHQSSASLLYQKLDWSVVRK